MSWHYSQVLVEEYLEENSLDGNLFVPLSMNPRQQVYSSSDKMIEFCRLSLSGMMCEPLTESLGEELLMWFLAASPARTFQYVGKDSGLNGERSGLWMEMGRIVGEVRPRFVFVENSPVLTSRGLGRVVGDLAKMGYGCRWGAIGADSVGASNRRERLWLVAYPNGTRLESVDFPKPIRFDSQEPRRRQLTRAIDASIQADDYARDRGNYVDVAGTMDRLKAIGNGQNPFVAAKAFKLLTKGIL